MPSSHVSLVVVLCACLVAARTISSKTSKLWVAKDVSEKYIVTEKKVDGQTIFVCDICGLGYADMATAQKCEDWCGKNSETCNLQISQKAICSPDVPILLKKSSACLGGKVYLEGYESRGRFVS